MSSIILPLQMRADQTADHFRLYTDDDLRTLPPTQWIVKGIVPTTGIGAIFGPSGSGKSFLSLDLLAHINWGMSWFGRRVVARPVIYIPFEGQGGIPKRRHAWELKHRRPGPYAFVHDGRAIRCATKQKAQVIKPFPALSGQHWHISKRLATAASQFS